jgi:plastocyanin
MNFGQKRLEISAGTTVTWTNNDPLVHTVTADDKSWDSGPIEPGQSWSHTFAQAGEFAYHCTPHPFMKAVVVVRQP